MMAIRIPLARWLVLLVALSAVCLIVQANEESKTARGLYRRAPQKDIPAAESNTSATASATSRTSSAPESSTSPTSATSATSSATSTPSSESVTPTSSTPTSSPTSQTQPSSTSLSTASSDTPTSASSAPPPTSSNTPPPPPPTSATQESTVFSTRTNAQGSTFIETIFVTPSRSATSSASSNSSSSSGTPDSGGGTKTSTIVGLSVAGAVALLGLVGFFVWKFTRKRESDDDFNDNEAIKWPDVNRNNEDGAPAADAELPARGFTDVPSRTPSRADGYSNTGAASVSDFQSAYNDPYAVPPLPHLNPNQPYRDDPSYYDPYTGPVPQALMEPDAIPMTQLDPARSRSPAPGMSIDLNPTGRVGSPGPAMMRAASPGPQATYGYGVRSQSPGPQAAYAYPARTASPAPQGGYGGNYGGGY